MSDELADLASKAKSAFFDDNVDEAHRLFTAAIDGGGRTADNYAGRAQVLIRKGLYKEAIADAEEALKINSSFAKAFLRKGDAYLALGKHDHAKAVLQLGAALNPGDGNFKKQIAEIGSSATMEEPKHPSDPKPHLPSYDPAPPLLHKPDIVLINFKGGEDVLTVLCNLAARTKKYLSVVGALGQVVQVGVVAGQRNLVCAQGSVARSGEAVVTIATTAAAASFGAVHSEPLQQGTAAACVGLVMMVLMSDHDRRETL